MMQSDLSQKWEKQNAQVFWGEIAPAEHVLHLYESEDDFLNVLGDYVLGGIRSGDCVIIIATAAHLKLLNQKLQANGFDPFYLQTKDSYIPLDAEQTLAKFMVDGWPDEKLFMHVVSDLLLKARRNGRNVRAFGEMVALLWKNGLTGATVRLEHLWNKFLATQSFSLFCAYPRSGFTEDAHTSMQHICCTHSKIIAGSISASNSIMYTNVTKIVEE